MEPTFASEDYFKDLAFETLKPSTRTRKNIGPYALRRFRGWFGTDPFIVSLVWGLLSQKGWIKKINGTKPIHLLWALNFLKNYNVEHVSASLFGVDEKTLRKWVWFFVNGISTLASIVVSFICYCFE